MKALVWMSFDLGVRGDFDGMYLFLGEHNAKECGDSLASFWFEYKKTIPTELTEKLKKSVSFDRRSRVYAIYPKEGKVVGKFIVGSRRLPPWAPYIPSEDQEDDIGE